MALQSTAVESAHGKACVDPGRGCDRNNLLSIIIGYTEMAAEALPEAHESRDDLDAVLDASRRCVDLTRRLLALGKTRLFKAKPVSMLDLLESNALLLQRSVGNAITVDIEVTTPRSVMGDDAMLTQVIMNLGVHARENMPDGGRVAVRVNDAKISDATIADLGLVPQPYGYIEWLVLDDGPGLTDDELRRVFEPFAQDSTPSAVTALGLATVNGIIRQHGGHVSVNSKLGRGTTFRILLPASKESAGGKRRRKSQRLSAPTRRVLIVESEDSVREMIKRRLRDVGFAVLTAADGPAAVFEVETCVGRIHLLLTEINLPSMDGRDLAALVAERNPEVAILFLSSGSVVSSGFERAPLTLPALLKKPFSNTELEIAVEATLAQAGLNSADV